MENKKTFGAFILRRRKELGMTQKEFAEKLFVTESAVSKWERGLSYPDITLIHSICSVLEISEHELLTGSEDTQKRNSERLADKYLRLTRRYRIFQYLIYGLTLLGCAIGNLCSRHCLDWFFIAVFGVLTAASLTLVPAIAAAHTKSEPYKGPISFGCFSLSLLLLLLSCCLYTGGSWFPVTAVAVLFGLSLLVLPFQMSRMPLPAALSQCKASVYLIFESFLIILLLLVCCIYSGGSWFFVAASAVLFGLGFFILPVLLKQLPLPGWIKNRRASAYLCIQSALLLLLLFVCCVYTGGAWFLTAALGVLLGLGLFILPVLLKQVPLPKGLSPHKALIYFSVETLLLFLLMAAANIRDFLSLNLPTSLIFLVLPWGIMLLLRYLPVRPLFRASACCTLTSLWFWLLPHALDLVMVLHYGGSDYMSFWGLKFDFTNWSGAYVNFNTYAIIIFTLALAAIVLAALGFSKKGAGTENKE